MRISDWSSDVCSSDLQAKVKSTLRCARAPSSALRAPSPASRRRAGSLSHGWTSPAAPPSPRPIANPARRLHHVAMPTLVILMIVGAIAAALWSSARAAAERAEVLGRNACRAANVQLLDQTVHATGRSEEHTSELQSLMRISYAVFCLKKKQEHIISI